MKILAKVFNENCINRPRSVSIISSKNSNILSTFIKLECIIQLGFRAGVWTRGADAKLGGKKGGEPTDAPLHVYQTTQRIFPL